MLGFIITATVLIGIALIIAMSLSIFRLVKDEGLKKYRSRNDGFADLLNYAAMIDDGVIICKSGALMAAWEYTAQDIESCIDDYRNAQSELINQTLTDLGNGWIINIDAIRMPKPGYYDSAASFFPDPISAAIDAERRMFFEGQENTFAGRFILTLTYFPPIIAKTKLFDLMYDEDKSSEKKSSGTKLLNQFKMDCERLEKNLSTVLGLKRLKTEQAFDKSGKPVTYDNFLRFLNYCISGHDHPVMFPDAPIYLDSLLAVQEFWSGVIPKVGNKFVQVVAIDGFPSASYPNILQELAEMPVDYRWSTRFIFMDQHEAIKHLEKFRKRWKQKIRGFMDQMFHTNSNHVDLDAASMVDDSEVAIAEVNSNKVKMGYYTSGIILMHENRQTLEDISSKVATRIRSLGFSSRIETINSVDAYIGSLPAEGSANVRSPLLNTQNLSGLIPLSSMWTGVERAPCPFYPEGSPSLLLGATNGSTPIHINLHVQDLGHTIILGPSGAGKSTLLGLITAQARRYPDMQLFVFDKGMSMYALSQAAGGIHYNIGDDDCQLNFCPLQYLDTPQDRQSALEWILTIMELNEVTPTPENKREVQEALKTMHATGERTLSDFKTTIQNTAIRQIFDTYTADSFLGKLLDADRDELDMTDFTVFEIEALFNMSERFSLPILLYLFRRIERSLTGQPAFIILDEAWIMLGNKVFREKIREWLKVLRKANCAVIMATQSLTDAMESGIVSHIIENTATRIFLPNKSATSPDSAALYSRMQLNERQIEVIANAKPRQHYYITSSEGSRLFELALGPLALAFIGISDKKSVNHVKSLVAQYGELWVEKWLEKRGLRLTDYIDITQMVDSKTGEFA